MDDKKKDLVPIAAIAVFLVIIIILCAVRLGDKKKEETNEALPFESVEMLESTRSANETETETETETFTSVAMDDSMLETEPELKDQLPSGKDKKTSIGNVSEKTISGNDPFAAAEGVNKTNEEMLMEMAGFWEEGNDEAISDLAHLAWFMKMSASIPNDSTFYYYGERNAQGQPNGTGIACYADNAYYYGQWVNGKREGTGEWVKFYVYYDDDNTSDRAFDTHMYMGEWANDMPNGEGQEHYDLNMSQAAKNDRYIQNVIGTFQDGLYSGEMYLTTLDLNGRQEEWNGLADEGVWSPYSAATNKKEIAICQDTTNDDNYLWITVKNNKNRGIAELMP